MSPTQVAFDIVMVVIVIGMFVLINRRHEAEWREHEEEAQAARDHARQCNARAETLSKVLKEQGIEFDADPTHYDTNNSDK